MINRRLVSSNLRRIAASLENSFDSASFTDWQQFTDERIEMVAKHLKLELECAKAAIEALKVQNAENEYIAQVSKTIANLTSAISILESEIGNHVEAAEEIGDFSAVPSILKDLKTKGFADGSNYNGF